MIKRCVLVYNNIVTNIIVADLNTFTLHDGGLLIENNTNNIGDAYVNGIFSTPQVKPIYQTDSLTFQQFLNLLSQTEQFAIINSTDEQIKLFCLQAAASDSLNLTDSKIIAGISYFASLNILTNARAALVLEGIPYAN